MRRLKTFGIMSFLFAAALTPANAQEALHAASPQKDLKDVSWLIGNWSSKGKTSTFHESWAAPVKNSMTGKGRELMGAKEVFHEQLRLEKRPSGLVYIAFPQGQKKTEFRLTKENENTLIFENPTHDFPKMLTYEKRKDGTLSISIAGDRKQKRMNFNHILYKEN